MEFRQPTTVVSTTAPTTVTTGTNYSSQKMAGIKQCRSNPDLEVDSGGPFKLLRKDSSYWSSSPGQGFLGSQNQLGSGDLKMNMSLNSDGSSFVCSPTSSCISDSAFLDCGLVGESRSSSYSQQMRPGGADLMMALNSGSNNASSGYGDSGLLRPFSYQAQPLGYGYRSTSGPTLLMGRESIQSMYGISPTTITASSGPFTSTQWAELEHQALIFKYMMAGANVPPDLLYPIRKSVAAMAGVMGHHPTSLGWGNFHLGMPNNPDPEPGRCRRTDGKKWRCSREVVPDQKYCERHMHRGRNRSKKNPENNSASAGTNSQASAAVSGSNNADSNPIQASNPPSNQLNRPQIGSNLQQKPIHQLGSSIIGGSGQFNPISQLQSAAAAQSALGGTKDYRFGVAEQGFRLMDPCLNVPESKLFGYGGGLRGRYVDLQDNAGQLDGMLGKGHNFFENGPLGEALQSRKNWGLNLLCDGWDSVPTSPKGVLQKSAFASLSDTSSSASSPIL